MTLQYLGKSLGANAVDSALCGSYFVLGERFLGGDQFIGFNKQGLIQFGMSAGSEFASDSVSRMILPSLSHMSGSLKGLEETFLTPVVSGGIYVLADMIFKQDQQQSTMYKLLLQIGASVLSGYTSQHIRSMIGV